MSRGGSYGGGKSSLSYLFEPDETIQSAINSTEKPTPKHEAEEHEMTNGANRTSALDPPKVRLITKPGEEPQTKENSKTKIAQDGKPPKHMRNAVFFNNGRPSTKVNSVPGGRSSLGYLFGDN
ncbi:Protein SPIRAL1-like 5 [Rhynchospora pubera]|uniref:Protein SPIRAL1-like 5 n=1 Tax=Rhynchospora pubera TaxID=906938 RepID=A0AAV8CX76_9POAL|nr:Protein SPIRAL1-like 5 [Rhynchospora pubera]